MKTIKIEHPRTFATLILREGRVELLDHMNRGERYTRRILENGQRTEEVRAHPNQNMKDGICFKTETVSRSEERYTKIVYHSASGYHPQNRDRDTYLPRNKDWSHYLPRHEDPSRSRQSFSRNYSQVSRHRNRETSEKSQTRGFKNTDPGRDGIRSERSSQWIAKEPALQPTIGVHVEEATLEANTNTIIEHIQQRSGSNQRDQDDSSSNSRQRRPALERLVEPLFHRERQLFGFWHPMRIT